MNILKDNRFLVRACASVLFLRILVQQLFPDHFIYIKESSSNLIVVAAILLLAAFWVVKKLFNNESFARTPFNLPIAMLLGAAGLSLFHSVDLSLSLNFFIILCSYILFFYILSDVLKNEEDLKFFGCYFILCGVAVAIFGLWEFFFLKDPSLVDHSRLPGIHYKRVGSVFALPNVLAGFLMLVLPFMWAALLIVQSSLQKRIVLFLTGIFLLVFFLTFSFLCSVNFILITSFFLPLIVKESFKNKISKSLLATLWGIFFVFVVLIIFIRANLSIPSRKDYLLNAFHLIKDHPWWGAGSDTFSIVSTKYVSYTLGYSAYVHNSYLQFWVENGILGFVASIFLVIAFFFCAKKALKKEQNGVRRILLIAFIWSLSIFFADNLTNFTMLRPSVSLFGWTVFAGFAACLKMRDSAYFSENEFKIWRSHYFLLAGIAVVLFLTVKIGAGLLCYQQGVTALDLGNLNQAEEAFHRAIQSDPLNSQYPAAVGSVNIRRYLMTQDKKYLKLAEEDFLRSAQLSPHSHRTYLTLCGLAKEIGDKQKARKYLAQAAELSPLTYKTSPISIE